MTGRSCLRCGRHGERDDPVRALAWVSERDGERVRWLCPECARSHTRDIEGKLPPEHW